ncbi:PAP2 family protein [Apilactobacillus micheneri]|uniref:phosphatase PAP2 family protein n=1 Tax=Apilactobacillus micheneri TaxID=1899430 RepID=UPI0011282094|nr:phosphatase PAP2 family protein [Apilactobacillus micheneri]TPR45470.1 PAP2 family protein [Apilactobacillus micheneri]TPR48916.1 PAP2 family protein [Apilactobacillus micheneri]
MIIDKDNKRIFKITLGLILSLFVSISVIMNSGYLKFIDSIIIGSIQKSQGGFKEQLMHLSTTLASPKMDIVWILIIAFFLWGFRNKIVALWSIFTIIGGDVVAFIVKNLVRRPRPSLHSAADTGFSFPSGHVFGIFIVISIVWIVLVPMIKGWKKQLFIQIITFIFLLLVMASRIYLNAHYPTDTLGAAFIAYTWVQISETFYVRYALRLKEHWRPVRRSYL